MLPNLFKELPIHWQGVDDDTPAGCTLVVTTVLGIHTTYVLRDGQVIGRIETRDHRMIGYVGGRLKGGRWIGSGDSTSLARRIADQAGKTD